MKRLAIIGAGPAGLMAGIAAAEAAQEAGQAAGLSIVILEKMPAPGRKLLMSGSGQCNLTHAGEITEFLGHYGPAERFVKPALHAFDNRRLIAFFEARGVAMEALPGGKVFPVCRDARAVLACLTGACAEAGVAIRTQSAVRGIARGAAELGGRQSFVLACREGERAWNETADALVLASGGASYPLSGSTGDGNQLAASLGQAVLPLAPALSPVLVRDWAFASCAGISLPSAGFSLHRGGRKIRSACGDVLFTHTGLSGPGILDFSRYVEAGDTIALRLVADLGPSCEDIDARLLELSRAHPAKGLRALLGLLGLPEQLGTSLLAHKGMPMELKSAGLTREWRQVLARALHGLECPVARLGDWKVAMASRGGIERGGVDPRTLGSRQVPGLFFAGEALDVDGDTGGYNLQFAFSSAWVAGRNAQRYLLENHHDA